MTTQTQPQWILSGSHLITGQPLYLWINPQHQQHQWRGHLNQATPIKDSERELWMTQAQLDVVANRVVDPYWITRSSQDLEPTRRREQLRTSGPSVRPDLTPYEPLSTDLVVTASQS